MIETDFINKSDIFGKLSEYVQEIYGIERGTFQSQIEPIVDLLHDDIVYYYEFPYVEKYYRDSYYHFYSRKHNESKRNSIRISIFANGVTETSFFKKDSDKEVQKRFLGFFTIRPTSYRIIGHSFISPLAFKNHNFVTCLCKKTVLVNGYKLTVTGFPYMSQDNETITCSEAALINVMEYFGTRYPEYSSILPSQINKILNRQSYKRQLPSQGLPTENISFVLKKLGFGTVVYSYDPATDDIFKQEEFKEFLYTYIESGIPIIATMSTSSRDAYHAVVVIGRKAINAKIAIKKNILETVCSKSRTHSFTDFFEEILIMNDNHPPYELVKFDTPAHDSKKEPYIITSFIVPLYSKIYFEAYQFKRFMYDILAEIGKNQKFSDIVFFPKDNKYILRYYLSSSKTYKNYIAASPDLDEEWKYLLIHFPTPKFIWIGEIIFGDELNEKQKINGIIRHFESGSRNNCHDRGRSPEGIRLRQCS